MIKSLYHHTQLALHLDHVHPHTPLHSHQELRPLPHSMVSPCLLITYLVQSVLLLECRLTLLTCSLKQEGAAAMSEDAMVCACARACTCARPRVRAHVHARGGHLLLSTQQTLIPSPLAS